MDKRPKASVVMSVYNEKIEWLKQSIDSILHQTFTDFEFIIVIDNPHYEEGIKLLIDYSTSDSRIILLFNESNIGLTKSLNKGIREAKGKYIVRMDADDVSIIGRLAKQIKFMDSHPDIVASGTAAYKWKDNHLKKLNRKSNSKCLRSLLIFESPIYHPSAIFRRIINGEFVFYDESFKYSQDYALWITLIEKYKVSNINKPLIKYRISESQISAERCEEQRVCALRNQRNAIKMLGIRLNDAEIEILQDITRRQEISHDIQKVRLVILSFLDSIKKRDDLDYSVLASRCLLIYVNRITENNSIIASLHNYFQLCRSVKHFSMYCLLSLISKYVRFN